MNRGARGTALASIVVICACATHARAQRPAGAETLSVGAVAESLKVLAQVRVRLEKDRNNAALWYHRGMLAWALYDRDRTNGGLKQLDWTRLGREADSAIRLAVRTEPGNARYKITQGQYYLGTGWIPVRIQSYHVFDQALRDARRGGDTLLIAEALVEKGRVHWRRYDPSSWGSVPADVRQQAFLLQQDSTGLSTAFGFDVDSVTTGLPLTPEALKAARNQLQEAFRRGDGGFKNEADYKRAEAYFREAQNVAPSYTRAYKQLSMLFADRERWTELAALARKRMSQDPRDAWAFMTAGLAMYRSGNLVGGGAALDSGFARLSARERARLDDIQRMIRPTDSLTVASWTPAVRREYADRYWKWSAPMWSRDEASPRTEFLARVTYAELRWTVDELRGKRGADSDRGSVHIRYGPADSRFGGGGGESWYYDIPRIGFTFRGMPTFATAYHSNPAYAYDLMDSIPARWDNIVRGRIDSLPVRVARFRARRDSVDVVFTSQPPVTAIRAAASIEGPVRTHFWLLDNQLRPSVHDSGATTAGGSRAFVRRVAAGDYLYRFEATAESSLRGARALAPMRAQDDPATNFRLSGFGMSDMLVATRVAPRGQGRRWSDFDYDPSAGSIAQGTEIALLWENYDFAEKDGGASYQITFSIERKYKLLLDRVRAKIVSSFSTLMGNEQTADRIIYRYERTTSHAPVIADYITLLLADLPGGDYDFKVEVLDRNSGRETSKTSRIVIRE